MAGETQNAAVNVSNVAGGQSSSVNMTMEEGRQTAPNNTNVPSADSLGVTQEQFSKYFNAETGAYNWQAHAKETEFKLQQKGTGQQTQEQKTTGADKTADENAAQTAVQQAGLDFDVLSKKIIDTGDIGKDDYEALKRIGIPEDTVRDYIESVYERAERHVANVVSAFGGEAALTKAAEFAKANYSKEELEALNDRLNDPKQYKLVVDLLLSKAGLPPVERGSGLTSPNAAGGSSTTAQPYDNQMEMVRDQRDPRYKTDPKFRQQVYARAAASTFTVNPRAHTGGL